MNPRRILPVHQPLSKQVVGVDGLRLLAAGLVLGLHLGLSAWLPSRNGGVLVTHAFDSMHPYVCYGWVGVEIFFVLSGFVIAYSAQSVGASSFARHRLFRLYPMAAICATICLAVVELARSGQWGQRAILSAYVNTLLFSPIGRQIDDPFWTLPVEVVFYFIVFFLLWLGKLRKLPALMTVIGASSTLYWVFANANPLWSGPLHDLILRFMRQFALRPYTLLLHGCFFALGVLLWECLLRRAQMKWMLACAICTMGGVLEIRYRAALSASFLMVPVPWKNAAAIWLFSVAVVVGATLLNSTIQQALGVRGVRLFRVLGLMTYPLYLIHNRLGTELTLWIAPLLGFHIALSIALIGIVMLAYFLAMVVDTRIQKILKTRFLPPRV